MVFILYLLLLLGAVTGQQCPAVTNVNPKSGLDSAVFTISGSSLDLYSNFTTDNGATVNYTTVGSTLINFHFTTTVSGLITVHLITNNDNCTNYSFTLDIKDVGKFI